MFYGPSIEHVQWTIGHVLWSLEHVLWSIEHALQSIEHVRVSIEHVIWSKENVRWTIEHVLWTIEHVLWSIHRTCSMDHKTCSMVPRTLFIDHRTKHVVTVSNVPYDIFKHGGTKKEVFKHNAQQQIRDRTSMVHAHSTASINLKRLGTIHCPTTNKLVSKYHRESAFDKILFVTTRRKCGGNCFPPYHGGLLKDKSP